MPTEISPNWVCSTSTYQHSSGFSRACICLLTKSRASWQQLVIEPSPLPKASTLQLSSLHRVLCAPNMEFSYHEKKKAKQLFWFMGCDPVKHTALAHKVTLQTLERSWGTEWENICYLQNQHDATFLHLTTDKERWLYPVHLGEELKRIRHTARILGLNSAPSHSKWCF